MKEILLISDKGGTGKTTLMKMLVEIVGHSAVYADCTFTSTWKAYPNIIQEDYFNLGQEAVVDEFACMGCGDCEDECRFKAIHMFHGQAQISKSACTGCGHCIQVCPTGALSLRKVVGGKVIQKEANGAIIVYGTLQYFPRNGIRPVRIIRDKAVDVIISYQKKLLICEAYPGWNRLTFSLIPFANILMPIIEPHPQVFDFLSKVNDYQKNYKCNIALIINKCDLNPIVTKGILEKYPNWNILTLPYTEGYLNQGIDKLKPFILPLLVL
ncbi:MAG: 4Fe-4S binding protein [Bacteroidales bacterium]|nr:4Fe-4S binding protein [Bacteroidales bacterium]